MSGEDIAYLYSLYLGMKLTSYTKILPSGLLWRAIMYF